MVEIMLTVRNRNFGNFQVFLAQEHFNSFTNVINTSSKYFFRI
jgi:hypothetical protein